MTESFTPTERTRVIREPHRVIYDREAIYKIQMESSGGILASWAAACCAPTGEAVSRRAGVLIFSRLS